MLEMTITPSIKSNDTIKVNYLKDMIKKLCKAANISPGRKRALFVPCPFNMSKCYDLILLRDILSTLQRTNVKEINIHQDDKLNSISITSPQHTFKYNLFLFD